jgi:hypothetical protein
VGQWGSEGNRGYPLVIRVARAMQPGSKVDTTRILEALGFERRRNMVGGRWTYFYAKVAWHDCPTAPLRST